ncbi:leucine-rich repeat domain-containing protein [Teredinibacter haidensis]|mgnify:CR=1 FL=1|uniref:leucine-rich repeat domain-containing protein n=1 Tax=Teredinibacter haidensis TaxID=2731755 RepID=UPI000948F5BC|nr:leucine-rich repeat domain-containing protein [Teredinibacter haidensis]
MTIKSFYLRRLSPIFLIGYLSSCSQYEFSINERTLYDPLEFQRSVQFADTALQSCVKTNLAEKNITSADQLKRLQCGPGKISSLAGLEIFDQLQQLGLSDNAISNIETLSLLPRLTHINLANNHIIDTQPLSKLNKLQYLNLKGNVALKCASISHQTPKNDLEVIPPNHCLQASH